MENIQLHYMDCDTFVLSLKTEKFNEDFKILEDIFELSNLDEHHEIFSNKNKKVIDKIKTENPKFIWINEFIVLRSKCYAFRCGSDSKNRLRGIPKSQSKNIKFVE